MGGACWAAATALERALRAGKVADLLTIALAGGAAALVYVAVLWLASREEVALIRRSLRRQEV